MLRAALAVVAALALVSTAPVADAAPRPGAQPDPRTRQALYVDPGMLAAQQGGAYATRIGSRAQAFWVLPEQSPTGEVAADVRAYTRRAGSARRTPVVVVYGIPDRDCGSYSSGGLPGAAAYRTWVRHLAAGLRGQHALAVLEPDAIPAYANRGCTNAGARLALLRYATRHLAAAGAWVYLDAGHSRWTPYTGRAALLKRAGISWARGISTNVSNFQTTASEKRYATVLLRQLRRLGVTGKHYVVDTSRNGARPGSDGYDVINPRWARVGKAPRLVWRGAFDGTLWVKHPGESDGTVNDGPPAGQWCDRLADRLLGLPDSGAC